MQVTVITKRGEPLPDYSNIYYIAQNTIYPVAVSSAEDVMARVIGMYTFVYPVDYALPDNRTILGNTVGRYPVNYSADASSRSILFRTTVNYPVSYSNADLT